MAERGWDRTRGLLGREQLGTGEGLLITSCNSVHTVGMRYAIDVVFIDVDSKIIKIASNLRPFRLSGAFNSKSVLELSSGSVASLGLKEGLVLTELNWSEHVS